MARPVTPEWTRWAPGPVAVAPTALRSFCEGVPALADVMAMANATADAVQHAVAAEIGCRVAPDPCEGDEQ